MSTADGSFKVKLLREKDDAWLLSRVGSHDGPVWMPKALYELKPARGRTWTLTPLSQVQDKGCRDAL